MPRSFPLYEKVAESIREKILSGKLPVNTRLSSQKELAETYNVSLITVKRALLELVNEGLLIGQPGKGVFVKSIQQPKQHNVETKPCIGVVITELLSPFYSKVLSGVEKEASQNDYIVLFSNPNRKDDDEVQQINRFLEAGVKGVVVASRKCNQQVPPFLDELRKNEIPLVFVSYISDLSMNYIGSDHQKGAYLATDFLIKRKYQHIAYVTPELHNPLSELRFRGYREALFDDGREQKDLSVFALKTDLSYNRFEAGYELGLQIVMSDNRPDAIFAFSDLVALGLKRAFLEQNIRVPDDLAIVGFDDIPMAQHSVIPLTTVRQPLEKIGSLAFDTLLRKINGDNSSTRIALMPELIIRSSTR